MIKIENVSFGYGQDSLFRGLTIEFRPGNIYGLLGMNGAGKSTLLKLITGLLFKQSGNLTTLGHDPALRQPGLLNKVFVLPEELNVPGVSGAEYETIRAPFYPKFDHAAFANYLHEFDVPQSRKLTEFSHGQKKKFLLSFGLACGSELLVMDEPTNGLDIPSKGLFRRTVANALNDQRTFIISTHQVRDVESLIDPIVVLHQGRVLLNRTLTELAAKLRMTQSPTAPAGDTPGLLYCEPAVGGFWCVWLDDGDAGGRLDLEILFNCAISNPEICASRFQQEGA